MCLGSCTGKGGINQPLSERFWKVTYSLWPYLITLQCSPKWKALSGSWGHWEVSDWHVAWHHSNVSIPRRTAEFNSLKLAVINECTTLEGKILGFTHTAVFSSWRKLNETTSDANWMSWPVGKSLYNVTCGLLVRPRQWPLRPWGGKRLAASPMFSPNEWAISKWDVCSSSVSSSTGCLMAHVKHHFDWWLALHTWLNKPFYKKVIHRKRTVSYVTNEEETPGAI